jgi:Ricin-type beta-trefoil lectin domain
MSYRKIMVALASMLLLALAPFGSASAQISQPGVTAGGAVPAGAVRVTASNAQDVHVMGGVIRSVDADAAGKCLDVFNWGTGPEVQMYPCHGGANQLWTLYGSGDAWKLVPDSDTGKCLDGYRGAYAQVVQYSCDSSGTQDFEMWAYQGAVVFRYNLNTNLCLDVQDWGRSAVVQLYDCHWGTNQQWV